MRMTRTLVLLVGLVFLASSANAAISGSERQVLLDLFNQTGGANWSDKSGWGGAAGTECSWFGVTCNDAGTAVVEIYLDANNLTGALPHSLFTLTELRSLVLSANRLDGSIPSSVSNLSKLEVLDLSANALSGELPSTLGALPLLQTLAAWGNEFTGSIPPALGFLSALRQLNLSSNQLSGTIPSTLGNLSKLEYLYLESNELGGSIPASLGNLSALLELRLLANTLSGPIPASLGDLAKLEILDLSMNTLSGPIPPELGKLDRLFNLELGRNQLQGSIPPQLGEMNNLVVMGLASNALTGSIPPQIGDITTLMYFDLSSNSITGSLPAELGKLEKLVALYVGYNELSGAVPVTFASLINLEELDISYNFLTGPLPDLGTLVKLRYFFLGENQFNQPIPAWIGNLRELEYIAGHLVGFSGPLPDSFANLTKLWEMNFYGNQLSGPLPSWLTSLSNLEGLHLGANRFTGTMPVDIERLSKLVSIDLQDNVLTGSIPSGIGALSNLEYLELGGNGLSGSIPSSLSTLTNLTDIRLERNELSGSLPSLAALTNLETLLVGVNNLSGTFPIELTSMTHLSTLSLGANRFAGPLPSNIGNMKALEYVDLSQNAFTGEIPASITELTAIEPQGLNLNYNALFTNSPQVLAFIEQKHLNGNDWLTSQTIAPVNVSIVEITDRSATLRWDPIAYFYDEGGYRITASTTAGGAAEVVTSVAEKGSTGGIIRGLRSETQYFFRVETVTHPHDFQKNLLVSLPTAAVTATTKVRQLAPPDIDVTKFPTGLFQVNQVPRNEDSFILTNFGDKPSDIDVYRGSEDFYTLEPTEFTLAPGASQEVKIRSVPKPPGDYWSGVTVDGEGVRENLAIYPQLLSVAQPSGTVVAEATASRIDLSGSRGSTSIGTATFINRGTAELSGVLIPDVPWIVVAPGVIKIPPGEFRTINFTVDRSKRPEGIDLGSITGTLSLVYIEGDVQGFELDAVHALDTLPAGVKFSIVTVVDTTKPAVAPGTVPSLLPQEVARFIAGVKTSQSGGKSVVSDLTIANSFGAATLSDVRLYFTPPGAPATTVAPVSAVAPAGAVSLSNVVQTVYGGGSPDGSLQLRSSRWSEIELSAVVHTLQQSGNSAATLPIFRSDRSAGRGQTLYLTGVSKSGSTRGDLIVQETSGGNASVSVEFLDASGARVGNVLNLTLMPFGMTQNLDAIPANAVTTVVTNAEASAGRIAAFVMMHESGSGDSWAVLDWARYFDFSGTEAIRVPVASRDGGTAPRRRRPVAPGAATATAVESATLTKSSMTDITLFNGGVHQARAILRYTEASGATATSEVTVPAKATLRLEDVLSARFGKSGSSNGYLTLTEVDGELAVSGRSRVISDGAIRGSAIPVVSSAAGLRLGESRVFAGLSDAGVSTVESKKPGTYRSALLLQETTGNRTKVRVSLLFADGRAVVAANISRDYDLAGGQMLALDRVSREIIGANRDRDFRDLLGVQLQVRILEGEGAVLPVVVVTENASEDTYVRIE